jgi:GH25 family lysozyme M1 (1,4-beta-N-acetylmuramidase)
MTSTARARWRFLSATAIGIAASTVLFGLIPSAGASGSRPDGNERGPRVAREGLAASGPMTAPAGDPGMTHPDQDYAGSEIAKHESRTAAAPAARTAGLDVSRFQGSVLWRMVAGQGATFAYGKATEGAGYTSPLFGPQYTGAAMAGLLRGAYHFALPDRSAAAAQADFFVDHGGGWTRDGRTLPPMLDLEYNPYGDPCYGLTQEAMRSWIKGFSDRVRTRTGRYPAIYTSTNWWVRCTGNFAGLGATNPLFVARYAADPGPLPAGWPTWTFWQFADRGIFPGDQDYFNGSPSGLRALARG